MCFEFEIMFHTNDHSDSIRTSPPFWIERKRVKWVSLLSSGIMYHVCTKLFIFFVWILVTLRSTWFDKWFIHVCVCSSLIFVNKYFTMNKFFSIFSLYRFMCCCWKIRKSLAYTVANRHSTSSSLRSVPARASYSRRSYDLYDAQTDASREQRTQCMLGAMAACEVICIGPLMVLR